MKRESLDLHITYIVRKVSKCGVITGPYFPEFGPEITPYLDTFHAVLILVTGLKLVTLIFRFKVLSAKSPLFFIYNNTGIYL